MSDVSCWFGARDVIERNTFVRAKRESVAILGPSDPVVSRNVFHECEVAIKTGDHGGQRRRQCGAFLRQHCPLHALFCQLLGAVIKVTPLFYPAEGL